MMDAAATWPELRASEIMSKLARLRELASIPFGFHVHPSTNPFAYFPADLEEELEQWSPAPFRYCRGENQEPGPQIAVVHSIGTTSEALRIWELRESLGPHAIIVLWLWDNHTAYIPTLRAAQAADLIFFSHSPHSEYLFNPASAVAGHLPACSAQWRHDEAAALYQAGDIAQRRHGLLLNYVHYGFAEARNKVIAAVRENIPEATVLSMPAGNRTRYFDKSRRQRFAEWMEYKTTLILPLNDDLSTRLFDALLCGLVPIVPANIPDIDSAIPEVEQQRLGIVRINSYEIEEIRYAVQLALQNFDSLGREGADARHLLALGHHLLTNRISTLLQTIHMLIAGTIDIQFGDGPSGPALYVVQGTRA